MQESRRSTISKYRPLIAVFVFVSIAGFSGSQVMYAIQVLTTRFDPLWILELVLFGFLLVLSLTVLLSIVYIMDRSQGRVKKRIAFVEGFLGDRNE
jgi:hypothetical protein